MQYRPLFHLCAREVFRERERPRRAKIRERERERERLKEIERAAAASAAAWQRISQTATWIYVLS
jgi:hypothetical protein